LGPYSETNSAIFETAAGRAFAIGYVAAAAQRMQQLLVGPGIVAMDIDTELHKLFSSIFGALEQLPKLENDQVVPSSTDLSVRILYFKSLCPSLIMR
jgi:hypothetical protein